MSYLVVIGPTLGGKEKEWYAGGGDGEAEAHLIQDLMNKAFRIGRATPAIPPKK